MEKLDPMVRMAVSFVDSEICPIGEGRVAIEMEEKEKLYIIHSSQNSIFGLAKF